jgi:hypothetical protein
LNLAIVFQSGFSGAKNIYLQATNPSGATSWQQMGTWTIPAASIAPTGVTPASGTGSSQTFTISYSDTQGYAVIHSSLIIVNGSLSIPNGCYLYFSPSAKTLYLNNDAGTSWQGPISIGQSGTLSNSQCTVNAAGSSTSGSGNILTLNLALTFLASFAGAKGVYTDVYDGTLDSGWVQLGTFTVTAVPLQPVSVAPSAATGQSQVFTLTYTDIKGYAAIKSSLIIVNAPLSVANGCYLYFSPSANTLYLQNNAATSWQGPVTIGQSGTLSNTQCTVSASGSSWSGSGNNLTLNLALSFFSAFAGAKGVYAEVYDGTADSGWVQLGAYTVAVAPIAALSVTPASGSGMSQTFSFLLSDSKGFAAISSSQIIVNNPISVANGCYVFFNRAQSLLYLNDNAGTAWQGPITIGQSTTLQNSQCTISAAGSSVSAAGNNLTLNVAITFTAAFAGAQNVYIEVYDGTLDTGWLQLGSWTVP